MFVFFGKNVFDLWAAVFKGHPNNMELQGNESEANKGTGRQSTASKHSKQQESTASKHIKQAQPARYTLLILRGSIILPLLLSLLGHCLRALLIVLLIVALLLEWVFRAVNSLLCLAISKCGFVSSSHLTALAVLVLTLISRTQERKNGSITGDIIDIQSLFNIYPT